MANLSADEQYGKGKVNLPLQSSFHSESSQWKKLPSVTVPGGVSWGTRLFQEQRQETEQKEMTGADS